MAVINDLKIDREAAGTRYANALVELREAYIGLRAVELALNHTAHFNGSPPVVSTFPTWRDSFPGWMAHPQFVTGFRPGMDDEVDRAAADLRATINGTPRGE